MALARPRTLHRLTHLRIVKLKRPGLYEDGGGLRLVVGPTLKKRWVMRVTIDGRRRERGLGGFPTVSLERARQRAAEWRAAARDGRDLALESRRSRAARGATFEDAFRAYFAVKRQALSNAKHAAQWEATMTTYVMPHLGRLPVADIVASDVLTVLTPLWFEKPETARRVLQRMEAVFRSAILRGQRQLASPCIGIAEELGGGRRRVRHHPALPWKEVGAFIGSLRVRQAAPLTKLALEFLVLTAARSGEVRGACWSEIDLAGREWHMPAARMKARVPHVVPLSERAVEILKLARSAAPEAELVFSGPSGRPLSDMTFTKLLRDMGYGGRATAHGFRSSFKVWAAEEAKVRDEVSEAALAHTIPEKVRAAYLRTQFVEERRGVMEAWATAVAPRPS